MGAKVLVAVILGLVALLGIGHVWSNYNQKNAQGRSVHRLVQLAKNNGQKELQLPAPIPYYASVRNLDEALATYTTVIAQPVNSFTQISSDSQDIQTWYKLRILDYLSAPENAPLCVACPPLETIPSELLPITENELVVLRPTGAVTIEGVKVHSGDSTFPDFQSNQKYLFFLTLDPNTRRASIELGPEGVSTVTSDGDLIPVNRETGILTQSLKDRYGKVDQLRKQLQFKRFPRAH